MSLYSVIFLLGCLMYATATPEPEPKYHSTKIIQQPSRPNPFKINPPVFNPRKDYGRPARVRRFVDNFPANFDKHNGQRTRDRFGQATGQSSSGRRGNLGEGVRHGDSSWVGFTG